MTPSIALVLGILVVTLVLFITEWVRMDLVALLVLATLALSGLVTPEQALAGFSSPAVVTVWAMFILSAGLSRTGVTYVLGRPLLWVGKGSEPVFLAVLMGTAALLSAFVNTVTVAAVLLPVVMDVARRTGRSPSRLLLPLALGALLGGPLTGISTPANILVTDALREAGLRPFSLFEFTPITLAIVITGVLFAVTIGRRLLPAEPEAGSGKEQGLDRFYGLPEHLFVTRIARRSELAGRTLVESRLGSALHLTVVAILRNGRSILAPGATERLQAGDELVLHGRPDHLERLKGAQHLRVTPLARGLDALLEGNLGLAEVVLTPEATPVGKTVAASRFRRNYGLNLLGIRRGGELVATALADIVLQPGDRLLLQGERARLSALAEEATLGPLRVLASPEEAVEYQLPERLFELEVPVGSILAEGTLAESRLGDAFALTALAILREGSTELMPHPEEVIKAGDRLVLQGRPQDLAVLEGLQHLALAPQSAAQLAELESQEVGAAEILLSPRTTIAGKTLRELRFREKYGLTVLALWREGRPRRRELRDLALHFGDALLVYGDRSKLELVASDSDFLVLDPAALEAPRLDRAPLSSVVMVAVLALAMTGVVPIAIAAVSGAALMLLGRCLTMEEAYQAIEWKAVFLIAGSLPLGVAIEQTGAAALITTALLQLVGGLGIHAVLAALFLVTVLATQVVPTAALVVLMSPVAISAAQQLGVSPHTLMMTVALAASSSYATPVAHPANILVMGPGGYRFMDYLRIGGPMTLVALIVVVTLVPVLWPP
jgi:di/tricarboxylate transporter